MIGANNEKTTNGELVDSFKSYLQLLRQPKIQISPTGETVSKLRDHRLQPRGLSRQSGDDRT